MHTSPIVAATPQPPVSARSGPEPPARSPPVPVEHRQTAGAPRFAVCWCWRHYRFPGTGLIAGLLPVDCPRRRARTLPSSTTTNLYDRKGRVSAPLPLMCREWLTTYGLAPILRSAVISHRGQELASPRGVNVLRIFGCIAARPAYARRYQGASTLTCSWRRNLFLSSDRNITRSSGSLPRHPD